LPQENNGSKGIEDVERKKAIKETIEMTFTNKKLEDEIG